MDSYTSSRHGAHGRSRSPTPLLRGSTPGGRGLSAPALRDHARLQTIEDRLRIVTNSVAELTPLPARVSSLEDALAQGRIYDHGDDGRAGEQRRPRIPA